MPESKRQIRSEEVYYQSGEVVRIRPVPPSQGETLIELQKTLLSSFIFHSGLLTELLRSGNEKVWGDLRKLSAIVPLVGPPGLFLDVNKIDDLDEICRVFFTTTTTIDPDTGSVYPETDKAYAPSVISLLNGINFWERLQEGRVQAIGRLKAQQALEISPQTEEVETTSPVEDPILTPSLT